MTKSLRQIINDYELGEPTIYKKVELTPVQKMSDNELCRKLDIARRNVEKWQKRIDDIQNERSSRYCHWKSMQDSEW